MAVKIVKRTYNEIFTDGATDWLLGNVGEWQTLTLDVESTIEMVPTLSDPIQVDRANRALILSSGKHWGELGFDPGMRARILWKKEVVQDDGTLKVFNMSDNLNITNISGPVMEVTNWLENYFDGATSIPNEYGDERTKDVHIFVDRPSEGCRVKYVHLTNENFDTKTLASFIDGSLAEFVRPNVNDSGSAWMTMEAVGIQSGMSIRKMEIKNVGKKAFTNATYQFQIRIQYMISSLFEDPNNFDPTLTIPSYLNDDGSLTDNFKIEFFPEWNNPNTMIQNDLEWTLRKGNTGWFNENFNELNNDFKVESLQYFDENGNVVDTVDFAVPTKVKAVITGVQNLGSTTECGFGFAWIPNDEQDFKNKKTPFYQNVFVSNGSVTDGFPLDVNHPGPYYGAGLKGASMDAKNVKFTKLGDKLVMEVTFAPNGGFFSFFENREGDRNFVIWASVADGTLARNFSNRVSLFLDHGQMVKNIPPAGNYPYIDNAFIEHPKSHDVAGESVLNGIVQDDILCRLPFRIPKDGSISFDQMTFGVEAFNPGTGADFALEKFEIDVTGFPVVNKIPQMDVDQSRGFHLNPGNNKNWVKIQREPELDTTDFAGFIAYFATKIRWEDWIQNPNTPADFYDATQLNKGFHNDWVHYLKTTGWNIQFFTQINVTEDGDVKQYKNQWKMKFVDYDQNANVTVQHNYFRDSDNTLLNVGTDPDTGRPLGVILSNEPTRIEISFDITDGGTWDLATTYAVTTIEIDRGAGRMEQRQLSSVWDSESDNPLKPVTGQTKLKMEVDQTGTILTTTCLVDPDLLDDGAKYRITGRVGCNDTDAVFDPGLYEFRYESIYE